MKDNPLTKTGIAEVLDSKETYAFFTLPKHLQKLTLNIKALGIDKNNIQRKGKLTTRNTVLHILSHPDEYELSEADKDLYSKYIIDLREQTDHINKIKEQKVYSELGELIIDKQGSTGIRFSILTEKEIENNITVPKQNELIFIPKLMCRYGKQFDIFDNKTIDYNRLVFINQDKEEFIYEYDNKEHDNEITIFASKLIKEFSSSLYSYKKSLIYIPFIENILTDKKLLNEYIRKQKKDYTCAYGFRDGIYYGSEYSLDFDANDPLADTKRLIELNEKKFNKIKIDKTQVKNTLTKIETMCKQCNEGYYVLGWSITSMCRVDIFQKFKIFPLLGLYGGAGTGKSTQARLFVSNIWGNKNMETTNIIKGTNIRFEKLNGSLKPVAIDEVKRIDFELLRSLATDVCVVNTRGTRGGNLFMRNFASPICLNGNEIIFPEKDGSAIINANLERIQFLKYDTKMPNINIGINYEDMAMLGKYVIENILPTFDIDRLLKLKEEAEDETSREAEVTAIKNYGIELVKTTFKSFDIDVDIKPAKEVNVEDIANTPTKNILNIIYDTLGKTSVTYKEVITTWRDIVDTIHLSCDNESEKSVLKKMLDKGIYITTDSGILLTKMALTLMQKSGTLKTLYQDLNNNLDENIERVEYIMDKSEGRKTIGVYTYSSHTITQTAKTGVVIYFKKHKDYIESKKE